MLAAARAVAPLAHLPRPEALLTRGQKAARHAAHAVPAEVEFEQPHA